jgi:hypothetical protein
MSSEVESPVPSLSIRPIGWGLSFAFSRKRSLFFWSLIPAIVEVIISWQVFSGPNSPQLVFLLQVLQAIASAWLLTVITMIAIQSQRGEAISPASIASRAMRNLPKTFISYAALVCVVVFSLFVLPLVFLALFFIWAPLFCVGELYAENDSEADDEIYDGEFDEDEELSRRPLYFFKNKSVLELGFARSLQFGARHIGTTFKLAVLIIFASVFPVASVDLLTPGYESFTPKVIKIFFSSFCSAMVVGIAAGAFLVMLPVAAREELGVMGLSNEIGDRKRFRNLDRRVVPFVGMLLVSLGCGALIWQNMVVEHRMPTNVLSEVRSSKVIGKQFVVDLRLSDPNRRFRWFNSEGFSIRYSVGRSTLMGLNESGATSNSMLAPSEASTAKSGEEEKTIKATRLVALDANGSEIPLERLLPHDGPLLLRIYFDKPEDSVPAVEYSIYYTSYFEESRLVYRGNRSEW